MLRGPATPPPPSRLEAGAGAHHSVGSYARHLEVYEPPILTFEPHEEGLSSLRQTTNSTESNKSASNYRQHQRQLSAPSFSDRRTNAPSHPPSRPQSLKHYSPAMPLTGDRRGGNSPGRPSGRPSGRSTPVEYDASPSSSSFSHQARTPIDTTPKSAAAQSRLGFFASSMSALTSRMTSPTQPPARTDDELCDLDIEAALYPAAQSPLDGGEAFSPAAYKNLQTNATGLLHRMQDAYRRRTIALREMQAEREAHSEEMEEMEMRTRNFKSQLESMAVKAAEQEKAMQQLVAELQAEKRARQEEQRSREKMFRVGGVGVGVGVGEEGSVIGHEDLCVDEDDRKRWRASNSTVKSDISIDTTDADSTAESESIFSRSRSPTAMTCVTESESVLDAPVPSPSLPPPSLHPRTAAAALLKTKSAQQLTAFQRLVKGISTTKGEGEGHTGSNVGGVGECRNCRGQDSSVAWNTVSLLRDENSGLKQRVAHLEVAVEGALDVINGIKI